MEKQDFLAPLMAARDVNGISTLGLAHVGDAVYELMVRTWLCAHGRMTSGNMHREAVSLVKAPAQAAAAQRLESRLTEEELAMYRRGRNTRVNSIPRSADPAQYHRATGLEALFGWLYLQGERERLEELFGHIMEENANGA